MVYEHSTCNELVTQLPSISLIITLGNVPVEGKGLKNEVIEEFKDRGGNKDYKDSATS